MFVRLNINIIMARKFLKLIENTIERYSNGGILTGDMVKLVSNYKSKDGYKSLSDDMKGYIDNYFDTDKNYYVVNIKTSVGTQGPGNNDNRGDSFNVEVAKELANGRYDNQGKVTLDGNLLQRIDTGINRHPTPDSDKYDNKVQIDPVKPEENEEEHQTMTQQGDSLKKSEISNPTSNTKIPANGSVSKTNQVGNYTTQYMG
tara:strand:- start:85 stop:690 length:606 start_codon:yes stop_codon:yes gene_type:complete